MAIYISNTVSKCLPEFQHVCRICSDKLIGHGQSVFSYIKFRPRNDYFMRLYKIADLMMSISSVKIKSDDGLPNEICDCCLQTLKKFVVFKNQIEYSNEAFHKHKKYKNTKFQTYVRKSPNNNNTTTEQTNNIQEIKQNIDKNDEENITLQEMEIEYLEEELPETVVQEECQIQTEEISNTEHNLIENNVKTNIIQNIFDDVEKNLENLFNDENPVEINTKFEVAKQNPIELNVHLNEIKCIYCETKFLTPNLLTIHIIEKHKYLSIYTCVYPNCREKFASCEELGKHNILHINKHTERIQCKICLKLFINADDCKLHTESHVGKNFKCNICSKIFLNEHIMKTHKNRHEKKITYLCSECGKTFLTKGELETHHNSHSEQKEYECEICDKKFKSISNLYGHRKVHFGVKSYLCALCGASFRKHNNLQSHLLRHDGIKNFKCFVCQKDFYTNNELKIHVRKHTGERPYECDICKWKFISSTTLRFHKIKYHENNDEN